MNAPLRTTTAAEGLERRRFTVAEVEAMVAAGIMDEDERVELIGGELVPMSPKGLDHEVLKRALVERWFLASPDHQSPIPATTFRLSLDTYLEPDVLIFDRSAGLAAGIASITGPSVLLVVEIADSSLRYDMGRKAGLYAGFGVRELWVIDAVRRSVRVHSEPSAEGYRAVSDHGPADRLAPAFADQAFALRLDELDLA
jgi:Uma2 family endonuclease